MKNFYPTRFEGGIEEVRSYHMVLLNTSMIFHLIRSNLAYIQTELFIRPFETEELTGWCIKEIIKRAFPEVTMLDHPFNDRYQTVADQLLFGLEHSYRVQITPSLQGCSIVRCFRVLPMMDKTMLAIGT